MEKAKWLNNIIEKSYKLNKIHKDYYDSYDIKRGLRNNDGTGVVVGFTKVGSVIGYKLENQKKIAVDGELYYRNYSIEKLISYKGQYKFERVVYLLLFGTIPSTNELRLFVDLLDEFRTLPDGFTENMILKNPSKSIMNKLQRSVLVLYSYDNTPEDISLENSILQSIKLIARLPTIMAYGYQAKNHYFHSGSLHIHKPKAAVGTAGNILHMIRSNNKYTEFEKEALELLMILHAEHGGGNNSAFATHVVSSSGTDIYSAVSTGIGSLKGPKHGGANLKVNQMIKNIKSAINYKIYSELEKYIHLILEKKAFDKRGLIYGMGHAVYTKSDPRAELLKKVACDLAKKKNRLDEYKLYLNIEKITKEIFQKKEKYICANVDLYSGFIYNMLGIPEDIFTPMFAIARVSSWCAHRNEQLISDCRIIRPAYYSITNEKM